GVEPNGRARASPVAGGAAAGRVARSQEQRPRADRIVAHRDHVPTVRGVSIMTSPSGVRIVDSADVSPEAAIGQGSSIWHLAQVREEAVIGRNCIIGRGAYIGTGVVLG